MIIGRMDRQVLLQRPVVTQGSAGEAITTWVDVETVWAGKRETGGREYFEGGARQSEAETLFTIRYRADLDSGWRVIEAGRAYDIKSPNELGRREGLQLKCLRITGLGE